MSVAPAQLIVQTDHGEIPAAARSARQPATPQASTPASTAAPTSSTTAPVVASNAPVSANLRIDNQHQFYYEFVDQSTGNVEFEIPPEALRAIGESLNVPLDGTGIHSVDVKL